MTSLETIENIPVIQRSLMTDDLSELMTPGVIVELTPEDAEQMGFVEDTAVTAEDAIAAAMDPCDTDDALNPDSQGEEPAFLDAIGPQPLDLARTRINRGRG